MRNDQDQAKNLSAENENDSKGAGKDNSLSSDRVKGDGSPNGLGSKVVDLRSAFEARRSAHQNQSPFDNPEKGSLPDTQLPPQLEKPVGEPDSPQSNTPSDLQKLTQSLQHNSDQPQATAVTQHPISKLSPDAAVAALLSGATSTQREGGPDPSRETPQDYPPETAAPARGAATLFWEVWQDHQAHLHRQSLRLMSGNRADAEDALSTAMLRASQKYALYAESIINQRAWLTRLLHNACMDHYRGQARRNRLVGDQKEEATEIGHPSLAAEPEHSPEEIALNREALRAVEQQVDGLPPNLRLPFLMRFVQDHSYNEIATHLELTNCAVRKRIQLARERLRQNLEF